MHRLRIATNIAGELLHIEKAIRTIKIAQMVNTSAKCDSLGSKRKRVQICEIGKKRPDFF